MPIPIVADKSQIAELLQFFDNMKASVIEQVQAGAVAHLQINNLFSPVYDGMLTIDRVCVAVTFKITVPILLNPAHVPPIESDQPQLIPAAVK